MLEQDLAAASCQVEEERTRVHAAEECLKKASEESAAAVSALEERLAVAEARIKELSFAATRQADMLRDTARSLFFKVREELKVPLWPRDALDFSSVGGVAIVLEEMVAKLSTAWKENLKREGRRVAEYVLACYASHDTEFPLYPVERGIRDVDGSGERARLLRLLLLPHASCLFPHITRCPRSRCAPGGAEYYLMVCASFRALHGLVGTQSCGLETCSSYL